MCNYADRENSMVVLDPGVWCDPCLAALIRALNAAGLSTASSCCGHGDYPAWVMLDDGRDIVIYPSHEANLAANDPALLASMRVSGALNTRPTELVPAEITSEPGV